MSTIQNVNGPAEAPTSPDHGSNKSQQEKVMNAHSNITLTPGDATSQRHPTNEALLDAVVVPSVSNCSLAKAIFTYRGEWNRYLAASLDDADAPRTYLSSLDILNSWAEPAGDWISAETALALAIEQYEVGDSDLITVMMKAVHGFLTN